MNTFCMETEIMTQNSVCACHIKWLKINQLILVLLHQLCIVFNSSLPINKLGSPTFKGYATQQNVYKKDNWLLKKVK